MKIGIVLSKTPGYSETFFNSKIKGLIQHGFEVELFVQEFKSEYSICKVHRAYPIIKRNLLYQMTWFVIVYLKLLFHLKSVKKYILLERSDNVSWKLIFKKLYINAHLLMAKLDWLHFGFATMALGKEHVAQAIGSQMAVSLRGFDIAIYPVKHPNCYDLLWQKVDKVHTISNDLYALAIKNGLRKQVSYQKITPAIDTNFFNNIKKVFKAEECLKIFTVARLHWKKGLSYTLRALAILKEQGVNFKYTIIGEGEQYEELRYTIHLLNLEENVCLLGKKTQEEIKEMMQANHVYLQYSISEGFCNAVLEAQAMGLLCVVSDAEGLPENVLHEKTGWVVPKRNPQKLAETIMMVHKLSMEAKKEKIKNAQQRVSTAFTIVEQQKDFVEFYKNF